MEKWRVYGREALTQCDLARSCFAAVPLEEVGIAAWVTDQAGGTMYGFGELEGAFGGVMAIPPCGTFHYLAVLPVSSSARGPRPSSGERPARGRRARGACIP